MTRDQPDAVSPAGSSGAARPGDDFAVVRDFMVRSWSELLRCSHLTDHSDFMARGGDSLLMTRLVRRIDEEFGIAVPPHELSRRNLGDQVRLVCRMRNQVLSRRPEPAPGTVRKVRATVQETWSELLGCAVPGTTSDFFALGGDSLSMTRLARRIAKELGVTVPLRELQSARTLGEQVLLVRTYLAAERLPHRRLKGHVA